MKYYAATENSNVDAYLLTENNVNVGGGKATIYTHTPAWIYMPKHNFLQVIFKLYLFI